MKAPRTDKLRTNVVGMVLAVVVFGLAAVFITVAVSSQDLLWFVKEFHDLPTRVVVYQEGQSTELTAGMPGFSELSEAVRATIAQGVSRPSGMGLSNLSRQDAYEKFVTVEAFYDQPVKVHSHFNTGPATQMLFPITGRYSDLDVAFFGADGAYFAGAPILKTTQPLREALKALGFKTE
jgi:hypothetical protein